MDNGVLRALRYSRIWAKKKGREALAWPRSWLLEGMGQPDSLEKIIASAKKAILVTRLRYIRMVDQRQILVAGHSRDAAFLVESGKITKALKNFRFNESSISVFRSAQMFRTPRVMGPGTAVPALSASKFRFTSESEAV